MTKPEEMTKAGDSPGVLSRGAARLGAAVLAGVLVFTSFPNYNIFPLAFVAMAPLVWAAERSRPWRAFQLGALTGLVTNAGGFYWIVTLLEDFVAFPLLLNMALYLLLCLQQGLTFAFFAWLGRLGTEKWLLHPIVAYPAAMAVAEWLSPMIFKWYFGNSQWLNHPFAQSAEIWGPTGISVLLVLCAVSLHELFVRRPNSWSARAPALIALALVGTNFVYGLVRISQTDALVEGSDTLSIGLVEADVGIFEKTDPEHYRNDLLIHQHLSAELVEQGAELVVWPETAYLEDVFFVTEGEHESVEEAEEEARTRPVLFRGATWLPPSREPLVGDYREDVNNRTPMRDRVAPMRGFQSNMLIGALMYRLYEEGEADGLAPLYGRPRRGQYYNSALLLREDGRVLGTYDKMKLMPISERVPLGQQLFSWFGFNIYDMLPVAGDFYVGTPVPPLLLPSEDRDDPYRIAVMICYEDIIPSVGMALNEYAPDIIINVTNDAWFGKTSEPYLHLALATFRAIENRTYLVRSTNTGVSAFIDPVGRVVAETSIEDAETLLHDTPMVRATRSPYMRFGEWLPRVCLLILLFSAVSARLRRDEESG